MKVHKYLLTTLVLKVSEINGKLSTQRKWVCFHFVRFLMGDLYVNLITVCIFDI